MGLFRNRDDAKSDKAETELASETEAEGAAPGPDAAGLSGSEMQRLWSDGLPARATVTEVRDTGRRLAGNAVLDLDLAVTRDGVEPYETTMRLPVASAEASPFAAGAEYNVRVDPDDRTRLVFAA
jgi:hypothetical protein